MKPWALSLRGFTSCKRKEAVRISTCLKTTMLILSLSPGWLYMSFTETVDLWIPRSSQLVMHKMQELDSILPLRTFAYNGRRWRRSKWKYFITDDDHVEWALGLSSQAYGCLLCEMKVWMTRWSAASWFLYAKDYVCNTPLASSRSKRNLVVGSPWGRCDGLQWYKFLHVLLLQFGILTHDCRCGKDSSMPSPDSMFPLS